MRIAGLLRVKNEARWIAHVLESIRPLCDPILVFDDHSTDGTDDLCESAGATVIRSTATVFDEAADKDVLSARAHETGADWCFMIDGDEILEAGSADLIRAAMERGPADSLRFRYIYLWDRPDQMRVDGGYASFWRHSAWRCAAGQRFMRTKFGGNMHCSSVPEQFVHRSKPVPGARILHLGYMLREDRLRKYEWYNRVDPGNLQEDCYRHMVLGDLPELPATLKLKHGGPLRLEALA